MTRPVLPRSDAAWREEQRRVLRILQAARVDKSRSAAWSRFVAVLARSLAAAIDPDLPTDEERYNAARKQMHEALALPPPQAGATTPRGAPSRGDLCGRGG
jgi:hypothetical protein